MNLSEKLNRASKILELFRDFYSQLDQNVFKGDAFNHPWLDEVSQLSTEQRVQFDAKRDHTVLKDSKWINCINEINDICSFEKVERSEPNKNFLGNAKKRHELTQLGHILSPYQSKQAVDFGGGVGNFAYFLEQEHSMKVQVLEQDKVLIDKGVAKLGKLGSKVSFSECRISKDSNNSLENFDLGVGLHTCGNFSNDIFRLAINQKLPSIINFGCCYTKIQNDDYNISNESNKTLHFNQRALSFATLGFGPIPEDFFHFREKIVNFKMSYYHWLYQTHEIIDFVSMSNSRRTLFDKSFFEFSTITTDKHFKEFALGSEAEMDSFYNSTKNKDLMSYFWSYYAIARYFGELIETYILLDRALFLENYGYSVKIIDVFDPNISPRNKAIIASL
jgi:hypothetical protein